MDNSLRSIVDSAKEILFLLPNNPDFDTVSSALSLYLAVSPNKPTHISCSTPMTVEFNRLVGVNKIKSELGGKNLTIRIVDYPAKNIEKVSYDIVNDEFRLLVVPKDGQTAPGADLVHLSYAGTSADTVILVGGKQDTDFGALLSGELEKAKIVHIGNKSLESNKIQGIMSLARPALSNSELAASLIKESGFTMDSDIATNLFSGLQKSMGGLADPEVGAETLEIAAYLLRSGAKRQLPLNETQRPKFPFPGSPFLPGQFEAMAKANMQDVESDPETPEEPPQDWLKPKIFTGNKGTSVS